MSLTTAAYYVQDINIPQGTWSTLSESIARYEGEIVRQLLGYDIGKNVLAYSSSNPTASTQLIRDIVEGKEYTEGTYTVKWNGLLNTDKVSILSYYVYIQVAIDKGMTLQNVGTVFSDIEGGEAIPPSQLVRKIAYRLRDLAGYSGQDVYAPSLYNFMVKHQSSYPTWLWKEFMAMNEFGI